MSRWSRQFRRTRLKSFGGLRGFKFSKSGYVSRITEDKPYKTYTLPPILMLGRTAVTKGVRIPPHASASDAS